MGTYIVQAETSKRVKIGTARNPKRRLQVLQVGSPERLRLVAAYAGKFEYTLHRIFDDCRVHGEWFDIDKSPRLKMIIDVLDGKPAPSSPNRISISEFAQDVGYSVSTIKRHIKAGEIVADGDYIDVNELWAFYVRYFTDPLNYIRRLFHSAAYAPHPRDVDEPYSAGF